MNRLWIHVSNALREFLGAVLLIVLVGIYMASLFAGALSIQRQPYGVAIFAIVLGLGMYLVLHGLARVALGYSGPKEFLQEHKWTWHIVGVVCIPLVISAFVNGSVEAAWNPYGYWRDIAQEKYPCGFHDEMELRTIESFRVTNNKYAKGLATVFEVKDAADAVEIIQKASAECQSEHYERKAKAQKRLKEWITVR